MALHSTKETPALKSACSLVLYSARWALYSTQPTQYFYSTGWVFSPILLQHWVGTLQHPKVPSAFTALRGYFTAPTIWRVLHNTLLWPFDDALQHRGLQVHPTSKNIEPSIAIINSYLCVSSRWRNFDLAMMNEVEHKYMGSLNLFTAIMRWPSTSFQSCVPVGFLHMSPYMFWIICKCFETLELLRLWLANRSPHSPSNRGHE